jgi:biopolymer transport protein ExbD
VAEPDGPSPIDTLVPDRGEPIVYPRRRPRGFRGHSRLALNLTAMIDVVFLLMIYFMLATEFKAGEEIYRMDLPPRQPSSALREPFDLDEQPLRLTVASIGPGSRGYRLGIEGPYPQPASFEELHEFLRQRRVGPDTTGGLFEPDHPIVVQPTRRTRWEHAVEVFNVVARARYQNVTFARPN